VEGVSQGLSGVEGTSHGPGYGVKGINDAPTNGGYGVYGTTGAPAPRAGVYGTSTASTYRIGVIGETTGGGSIGVEGLSDTGTGVFGSASNQGYGVWGSATGGGTAIYGSNPSPDGYAGFFSGFVYVNGNIAATGTITPGASDIRLKKNVKPLNGALDRLLQLRGVTYEWIAPAEHGNQIGTQRGFIAQEVEKVMPEWISTDRKGFKMIAIPGRGLEAMLVESVRELKTQNDDLRVYTARLEERIDALEGKPHRLASHFSQGLGGGVALGLLPLGLMLAWRKRKDHTGT